MEMDVLTESQIADMVGQLDAGWSAEELAVRDRVVAELLTDWADMDLSEVPGTPQWAALYGDSGATHDGEIVRTHEADGVHTLDAEPTALLARDAAVRGRVGRADPRPDEALRAGLTAVREGLQLAQLSADEAVRLAEPAIVSGLEELGAARVAMDAVLVTLAVQAADRGVPGATGFGLVDWLALRCPWLATGELADVARVVRSRTQPLNAPLVQAVAEGRCPARRGAVVAKALDQLSPVLDPEGYEAFVGIFTDAACDAHIDDAGLREVIDLARRAMLDEMEKVAQEKVGRAARSFTSRDLGAGLTRFTIDAPAEDAAVLKGIVTSRLAKPTPDETGPDPRTATQRRYDAFTTVVGRGNTCPEGTGTMPRATVMVTMSLEGLTGQLRGAAGTTSTGDVLSVRQVRKAACEAEIIPVLLGGPSEILDMGRAVRLATPGQVKALRLRDKGCSFPGCTVPPEWCIAHHLQWWSRGGSTDLDVLALLCERHHTHAHEHDLDATVEHGVVVWHT